MTNRHALSGTLTLHYTQTLCLSLHSVPLVVGGFTMGAFNWNLMFRCLVLVPEHLELIMGMNWFAMQRGSIVVCNTRGTLPEGLESVSLVNLYCFFTRLDNGGLALL
eukprot:Protomagalhaensia_sp_Gyna_25__3272@NODE_2973_length_794_cov_28_144371_g2483_i0_p2_GENE_NODE_2973_length_794_cov_28_144371_g2483_i0NODE_2973_length_794_cov_28_144371_g2483_i0_p2_ORF_typecomplete_len107_score7_65_NODE_2973_length_794_cov_28_144371_g2483_i080400